MICSNVQWMRFVFSSYFKFRFFLELEMKNNEVLNLVSHMQLLVY